jgi:hypothetical protein
MQQTCPAVQLLGVQGGGEQALSTAAGVPSAAALRANAAQV